MLACITQLQLRCRVYDAIQETRTCVVSCVWSLNLKFEVGVLREEKAGRYNPERKTNYITVIILLNKLHNTFV